MHLRGKSWKYDAVYPDGRVETVDAGHLAPMERPEAVSTALREWLAGWRLGPSRTPA
jgi:carboxypeptidase C (cathepsin A)